MKYQVVLYDSNNQIINITKGLEDIQVNGNNIEWSGGGMIGINVNFAILDDSIPLQVGDTLTTDQLNQDQKTKLSKVTMEQQLEQDQAIAYIFETLIAKGLI